MNIFASPALKQVESALGISSDAFAGKHYHSVFNVIRQSRKQFITTNMSWLGSQGGDAWDLAMGQAQHIRRLFRESRLTQQVRKAIPRTLSGHPVWKTTSPGAIQGLVQDGPDWQNQFGDNWQAYCQSGSPEAYDSPVSYLTWLYTQALSFEEEMISAGGNIISLSERRPDLAKMVVNNDAVNQEIPALQLVNEILGNNIASTLDEGKTVDETLAVTRYPTLLPYHFPHDQTELSLQNAEVPLEDIIGETSTDWPWFLDPGLKGTNSNNASELASRLAPEQQIILTETTPADLTAFYKTNLGLNTPDYTPFEALDTFTRQLGISVPQTEKLLAGNAGGATVTLSPNVSQRGDLVFSDDIVTGHFANALSLYNRQGSNAWFSPKSETAIILKGDRSFSISMWINVSAQPSDNEMPLFSNCLMDGANQGFSVAVNGGCFRLDVADSAGHKVNSANKKSDGTTPATVSYNTWYFMCLTWDSTTRKVNVYYQATGESAVSTISVNMSTLTGDITTRDGFTWVLNDSGDFSYYNKYPTPSVLVNCLYDDIGVFAGALTTTDVQKLASSTSPLPEVTALSQEYKSYYDLDVADYAAASENYGASYINKRTTSPVSLKYVDGSANELSLSVNSYGYSPKVVKGKFDKAYELYATKDSYIRLSSQISDMLNGAKDFSIGFWLKISEYPGTRAPVISNVYPQNGETGFSVEINSSGSLHGVVQNDQTKYQGVDSEKIKINVWHYVALTWNITDGAFTINISIDGSSISLSSSAALKDSSFTTQPNYLWTLNESGDTTKNWYKSDISNPSSVIFDELAIWEGVITQEDITFIASSSTSLNEVESFLTIAPSAYYSFNQNVILSDLSDDRMERINRMVRLQRWLDLSYEECDLLLSSSIAAQGINNQDYTLNIHTLRALGVFRHWQQKYGVTAFQFAAVLHQITPYAISPGVPFLDQVFNSPSLFDEPFAITGETVSYGDHADNNSVQIISQLCGGLGLSRAQFLVLADKVTAQQGNMSAHTFPLTLNVVSAFYRLAMIPRWLGLSFAEGSALLSLVGADKATWNTLAQVPQLATLDSITHQPTNSDILDTLMALDAATDWTKVHGLSWVKNYLDLQPAPDYLTATAATTNFVNGIKQQLPATLLSEQSFAEVPEPLTPAFTCPQGQTETTGIINNGAVLLDSTKHQYAQFTDKANTLADGSSSYSLGFWVSIPSTTTASIPVAANSDFNKQGIFITKKDAGNLGITLYDDQNKSVPNATLAYSSDTWFYLALTLNTPQKILTVYSGKQGGTVNSVLLDYNTLSGKITTVAGNAWRLNEDGPNTFYSNWPANTALLSYDDITLWDRALTKEQIASIVASGKAANLTVPATLSTSPFTNWMTALDDLVDSNGLVRDSAHDYNTIHVLVQSDIAGLTFDSGVDTEQLINTLSDIIYKAMLTQNGIADSALTQMFSTPQALSAFLFQWAGDSEYRLLSESLTMNAGNALTDPTTIPMSYLTHLYALGQRAGIASHFSLTPAALSTFLTHPGWLDNTYSTLSLSLSLIYRLSRYSDWLKVAIKEDAVLAYLAWVNGTTTPDAGKAANTLASLLAWDGNEVMLATAGLTGKMAKSVADVDYVMRLQALSAQTGLSVTPLLDIGALKPGGVTDTWEAWQIAGAALVAIQANNQNHLI